MKNLPNFDDEFDAISFSNILWEYLTKYENTIVADSSSLSQL